MVDVIQCGIFQGVGKGGVSGQIVYLYVDDV